MRRHIGSGLIWAVILGVGYFGAVAVMPPPDPQVAMPPPIKTETMELRTLPFYIGSNLRVARVDRHDPMGEGTTPIEEVGSRSDVRR